MALIHSRPVCRVNPIESKEPSFPSKPPSLPQKLASLSTSHKSLCLPPLHLQPTVNATSCLSCIRYSSHIFTLFPSTTVHTTIIFPQQSLRRSNLAIQPDWTSKLQRAMSQPLVPLATSKPIFEGGEFTIAKFFLSPSLFSNISTY